MLGDAPSVISFLKLKRILNDHARIHEEDFEWSCKDSRWFKILPMPLLWKNICSENCFKRTYHIPCLIFCKVYQTIRTKDWRCVWIGFFWNDVNSVGFTFIWHLKFHHFWCPRNGFVPHQLTDLFGKYQTFYYFLAGLKGPALSLVSHWLTHWLTHSDRKKQLMMQRFWNLKLKV